MYKKLQKAVRFKTLKYYQPDRGVIKIKNIGNRKLDLDYTNYKQFEKAILTGQADWRTMITGRKGYTQMAFGEVSRQLLYRDYDLMDVDIISSALDILADECCVKNYDQQIVTIISQQEVIKSLLYHLFKVQLNVDYNLWGWVRNVCKYGDFFIRLIYAAGKGILDFQFIKPKDIAIYYDQQQDRKYYIVNLDPQSSASRFVQSAYQFEYEIQMIKQNPELLQTYDHIFTETDIIHFSLQNKSNEFIKNNMYGKSYLDAARRVWKQLELIEQASIIHRIVRSPQKRIYYIDTGNLGVSQAMQFVEKVKNKIKRVRLLDEEGDYNLNFNFENVLQDIFLPTRGGQTGTKVDTMQGLTWNATQDIQYFRNKLIATLKIPRAFLTYDETINAKATLSSQSVRFAKTIGRIQQVMIQGLRKMALIHLLLQGFDLKDILDFDVQLTNPSIIDEEQKLNIMQTKITTARDMKELRMFTDEYIYQNVFDMSEDEAFQMLEQMKETLIRHHEFEVYQTQGQPEPEPQPEEEQPEEPEGEQPEPEPQPDQQQETEEPAQQSKQHKNNMEQLGHQEEQESDKFHGGHPDTLDKTKS